MRLLTDASGNQASSYNYSAFGQTRTSSGSIANEVRFTGERTDTESGLEFLRARTYDPSTGTFLSRDSWGITPTDGQSLDLYGYTQNSPINFVDPSGHCFAICIDIKPPSLPIPDLSTAAHVALGAATFVPGIGSAAAVADAGLYAYEGDYESAAFSVAGFIPIAGPVLSKGERALKFVKDADKVANVVSDVNKVDKVVTSVDKAQSAVNDLNRIAKATKPATSLSEGWRATNWATKEESFIYHAGRHAQGRTWADYAESAQEFLSNAKVNKVRGNPLTLKDGSPGIRVRSSGGGPGGIIDRLGKIIDFWFDSHGR